MTIASPCIRLCVIDETSGLCLGCCRTLAEIAAWGSLDEAERRVIMARLRLRDHVPAVRPADADP